MASDDYRKAYAPPEEPPEASEEAADAEEDEEEDDEGSEEEEEEDDEEEEEDEPPPPRPEPDPVVAGTRQAGILLGLDAGGGAGVLVLSLVLGMNLKWIYWLQPVVVGGLAAIVLILQRELRGVVLFVFSSLALYLVVRAYPSPGVFAASWGVAVSIYAWVALVAAGRVLPLVRLLFGRPSRTQRQISAWIMGAAIVAIYGGLAQFFLIVAGVQTPDRLMP